MERKAGTRGRRRDACNGDDRGRGDERGKANDPSRRPRFWSPQQASPHYPSTTVVL